MPEVRLPHLDEEQDDASARLTSTPAAPHRKRSMLKLLLEVGLITAGVFLGLAGESWRESMHHRDLAQESLQRFREEFRTNRAEVLRVHETHVQEEKAMLQYIDEHGPALFAHLIDQTNPIPTPIPNNVIDSAGFDYSAWDVALATESLAYIDPELVAKMSRAYRMQQIIEKDHDAIAQVSYSVANQVNWFRGVTTYFGDTVVHEQLLLKQYDELLPLLEKAGGNANE